MKLERRSRPLRLVLLALVLSAAGLIVWVAWPGDSTTNADVDRSAVRARGAEETAALARARAQAEGRRPESSAVIPQPADAEATRATRPESAPSTARFTVQTVDGQGIPVPGISASVDVFRYADNTNGISVLAPGPPATNVLGRPARRPNPRDIVHRISGPELIGDREGLLVLELSAEEAGPGRLSAIFEFRVEEDSPFAAPDSLYVNAGETRRATVVRGGSIEVHLAPLPGGAVPHVHPRLQRRAPDQSQRVALVGPPTSHHADVELLLYRGLEVGPSRGHSVAVDTVRWDRLSPGNYEIRARAPAWFGGRALATLPGLVVDEGGACDDPRLAAWNPFAGHDVMFVTVEGPDGGAPPTLTVGYGPAGASTAWWSKGQTARYDGRALPIVGPIGVDSAVTLQSPDSRRASIDIEPGARHVVLEAAIELELLITIPPGMVADPTPLRIQLVQIGDNGVPGFATATETLVGEQVLVRHALPVPGRYQVRRPLTVFQVSSDSGTVEEIERQRFETITIEVEDAPVVRREIELVPVR